VGALSEPIREGAPHATPRGMQMGAQLCPHLHTPKRLHAGLRFIGAKIPMSACSDGVN